MNAVAQDLPLVSDGLPIKQVSDLMGVPAPTLRSWERRYGVPAVSRSAGGHRRYVPDELKQIRLMRDEIGRGKRAAEAALAVRILLDQSNPSLSWISRLLAASERSDPAAMRAVLDQSLDDLGLADTLDQVLMPTMRQVGAWWDSGRCDVGQEHITTETARGWLARLTTLSPLDTIDPPILLACGPLDMHTLGLEALAALLAEQGRGTRVLGGRTSALTLVTAATATAASAVVVVSQLHTQRRPAVDALRTVARTGCPLFYAGNAFAFPDQRVGVPGTYLGDNFATARDMVLGSTGSDSSSPQLSRSIA
ncbi:B12-binding domain-containing protein [Aeromicrobium sp.]|uniref:B12-binding domain-containing protein n=1 Tax=Aeromicrobium sp. TaxID=1871063 RepID=UPI0019BA677D|nr:B12-binding domain-containing protein [Aeromicrobium sp.]MBC7629906.1 MerR family DNA-binding transcriptional regulator [Aeromicrobium sp.]